MKRGAMTLAIGVALALALAGCTAAKPTHTPTPTSSPVALLGHGTVVLGSAHFDLQVTSCQRQGILLNVSAHTKTGGVTFAAIIDVTHHNPNYFVYVPSSSGGTHYIGTGKTAGHPGGVTFALSGKRISGKGTFSVQTVPAPVSSARKGSSPVPEAPTSVHGTVTIVCGNILTVAAPKPEATIQPAPSTSSTP